MDTHADALPRRALVVFPLHWEQGSDVEGAARRGLYDAIWSREHLYDTFTVPRRYGRTLIDTGRTEPVMPTQHKRTNMKDRA